ncbi:MAG: zinc ribbon domain-containing protein [Deltaproteobacteria bacterium]|nr:zinc ribbon domain-containing protein [Deltaproteobacteria bacterium]MBW2393163.1 zinc ribbon domain-containing protein [Deltaproteobacteria bacterium]
MPVYDYQCKGCGHEFSKEQRITENPVKKCPKCGAMKSKRLISQTAFVLKGSGWYNDLYASNKPAKKEDAGKESSDSKSDSKSDDKPAKKDSKSKGSDKSGGKSSGKGGSKKGKSAA